jgi:hypothetical protein
MVAMADLPDLAPQTSPGDPDGGVGVLERPETAPIDTDSGDHERFAHYVQKNKIVESAVTGAPVIALCGKKWVPNRDPGKFPVCPECKEIFEGLPPGGGKGRGGDSGRDQ